MEVNKPTSWIQGYTLSYGHFERCLEAQKSKRFLCFFSRKEMRFCNRHFWLELNHWTENGEPGKFQQS